MPETKRLHSLDALRGFDMFWIVGGGSLVYGNTLYEPLDDFFGCNCLMASAKAAGTIDFKPANTRRLSRGTPRSAMRW